jgi:hypothetical protein
MALSKEDHGDVKAALGKAMANKISKVTRDGLKSKGLWISKKTGTFEGKKPTKVAGEKAAVRKEMSSYRRDYDPDHI